jgi:hypothetical protein
MRTAVAPDILSRLQCVKRSGSGWTAKCPAHDDRHASLSISVGDDGRTLLHCHAGCDFSDIVSALGVEARELFPQEFSNATDTKARIAATYDYVDADGRLLYQVVRYQPKGFKQRRPDGNSGYIWNLDGVERLLYRLPEITKAIEGEEAIFICEGEKDCDNLAKMHLTATTNVGGAGKWRDEYSRTLRYARVVILSDKDDVGKKHTEQVALSLYNVAASIKIINLPDLPPKGDVSDWLQRGGTRDELLRLVESSAEWHPTSEVALREESPIYHEHSREWPQPLAPEAFQGIAGDIVRIIEPETEADPAALLFGFLAAFGNLAGPNAYFRAEADQHHPRLFVTLVGETSKGRKGTAQGHIRRLCDLVEPKRPKDQTGLSSGEGIIWGVRDRIEKQKPIKDRGHVARYEMVKVIDGRNRLRACKLLNRKTVEALSYSAGGDAIIRFVISENLHRRYLTESQRADIAARLAGGLHGSDRVKAHICALTQAEAAKQLGVSERSLQNARFVHQHGIGSLRTALAQGAVPVSAAWREAGQPASRCTSTWDTTR